MKIPKQDQSLKPFKAKEVLLLSSLSAEGQTKMVAAMKSAASKVRYTGSAYHRSRGSKSGHVAQRVGFSSRCPPNWTNSEATRVLRTAIREGLVSPVWEHGYPRHVWHLEGDVLYEARLTNSGNGEYHAYPLENRWQWPKNCPF